MLAPSPFVKTYKNLDRQKKVEYFFQKETHFSFPVVVRREDGLYDGLFVYTGKKKDVGPRPHGWVLLSMEEGEIHLLAQCRAADFIDTTRYPLDGEVSMLLPESTVASKVKRLSGELLETYEELRLFAFDENLSREQVNVVVRYKDLFMRLCPKGLYPFYHSLAPAFFHWLRLPLPDESGVVVTPEKEETREYQYQLLILENLQQLVTQFQSKIAVDSHKNTLFDELHEEVQRYKNGLIDGLTRHVELDVIALIDSLGKSLDAMKEKPADAEKLLALLAGVETDLCDILYRQGIDPYTVPGDEVDISRQTTIATMPTDEAAKDRRIAARHGRGWEKSGKVIRPERVSVYIYN
jgi:molecular chaperone GrpE